MNDLILRGDSRVELRTLPSKSIHCVITSPPYWGLRSYLPAGHPLKHLEIGQEQTPELYVKALLEVFREVHRVMRDDATLWLNIGDTHTSGGRRTYDPELVSRTGIKNKSSGAMRPPTPRYLKCKELVGIPWRVAFALQGLAVVPINDLADLCKAIDARDLPALDAFRAGFALYEGLAGMNWFWHRMDNIWYKTNGSPESVRDRPSKAHEYLFLLAKSKDYFYDQEPIREPLKPHTFSTFGTMRKMPKDMPEDLIHVKGHRMHKTMALRAPRMNPDGKPAGSNKKSVWCIGAQPTKTGHTATFPEKLVRPCIMAGTSEKGCCPTCGAQWVRIVIYGGPDLVRQRAAGGDANGQYRGKTKTDHAAKGAQNPSDMKRRILEGMRKIVGFKWEPSCKCYAEGLDPESIAPPTVLDPFSGAGTVRLICHERGLNFIGCELDDGSVSISHARSSQPQFHLPSK